MIGVHVLKETTIKNKNLEIEIADTPLKRSLGLMYRKSLAPNSGMLFKFNKEKPLSFWMKDTHIPLSIAYLNKDGVIINIENMNPFSLDGVKSMVPCKYALEVNQGWFEQNGIKAGDQLYGILE